MKQRDVEVGQVYLTKVSPHVTLQEVVVVDEVRDFHSGRTRFRVRRNIPGSPVLPKSRAASALHERAQKSELTSVVSAASSEEPGSKG